MTPGQPSTQRQRLGNELRRVRMRAGMSGRDIARHTSITQPTVSRMERGLTVPSSAEISEWARAANAGDDARALLLALHEAALNELTAFTPGDIAGHQEDVNILQESARTVVSFQPALIPGLLQTTEYATAVLSIADPTGDIPSALARRMQRQADLYRRGRRFTFILTEGALRWNPGNEILSAQLAYLAAFNAPAVTIQVIPLGTVMHAVPSSGFTIYEDVKDGQPFVRAELPHAVITVNDPQQVDKYRDRVDRLTESALSQADSQAFIRAIAEQVSGA